MTEKTFSERIYAFEYLRATMVLLGIVIHIGLTYGAVDYGNDWLLKDPENHIVFDLLVAYIHFFRMPVFFVVSGYLSAKMFFTKGDLHQFKNRMSRILLPFIAGVFIINPFVLLFFYYSTQALNSIAHPIQKTKEFLYSDQFAFFTIEHLWFLYFLFLFACIVFIFGKVIKMQNPMIASIVKASSVILKNVYLRVFLITICILLCLIWNKAEFIETTTDWLPNASIFTTYFIIFMLGWLIYATNTLEFLNQYALLQIILATLFFLVAMGIRESFPLFIIQIIVSFSVGLFIFGMIALFLTYYNRPNQTIRYISDASYFVYLIHLPIVCLIPGLLAGFTIGPFFKFFICLISSIIICFTLYHFFVRNTFIGVFLNGKKKN